MNIITEPTVRLVSTPHFIAHPRYLLPPHESAEENIIAMAGKVCYDSYGLDGNKVPKHVQKLVKSMHYSVLEHTTVGLFIEGISRGCSHEIVRHRHFSYSQRSTRYTAEGDAAIVLDPFYAHIYQNPKENLDAERQNENRWYILSSFIEACEHALVEYQRQIELLSPMAPTNITMTDARKWCRGKARQLLPHALETRMVMTGNLRSWREFLIKRTSRHAEGEIRRLADEIWSVLEPLAPAAFSDMVGEKIDGYVELTVVA